MSLVPQIEAILFVASKPLTAQVIAKALGVDVNNVIDTMETLTLKWNTPDSGLRLLSNDQEFQLVSNPDCAEAIDGFVKQELSGELTKAQLETLTVIAYRGPVTRPELEQIRGVNCSIILRNLLMRGLIVEQKEAGGFSPSFLLSLDAMRQLGIASLGELPNYQELHEHPHLEQVLMGDSVNK